MSVELLAHEITCPVCGFSFDPDVHPGCRSCPLHANCATACCPRCGHTTINPRRSTAGRLASILFKLRSRHEPESIRQPSSG